MLRWAPLAFTELLARRRELRLSKWGAELDNPLAYRETDRHIYRTFLKRPLSGSFDKLGNNATVAMVHTSARDRWPTSGRAV